MARSNTLMFHEFCMICDKISSSRRDKKAELLLNFINDYKATNDVSFYRVLRFLLPQLDRERAAYGIKETTLAKIYIRLLCMHPESKDALKLKNFCAPKNAGNSAGDFGEVAFWVLKSRCAQGKELSLDEVHQNLDAISRSHADKKPRDVDNKLEVMLRQMSAQEQKWLIRIILKDMKLGLGRSKILSTYHPDATELYDFTNSLEQVCEKLPDPLVRLHEIEVTLFTPFRPMLAERCDVQNIGKLWTRRSVPRYIETKLDGERSQLHYSDGKFKFFSRNAFDFSDAFGSTNISGSLTPYLAKQLKPSVKSCILDGEMMPWNTRNKYFGTKAMNLDVKTLRVGNVHQPCFCAFDILYFNGSVLTNKPLRHRLEILEQVFTPCEGIMMHVPRTTVNSGEEVLAALNNAIDNLEEGIVVKETDCIYKPNGRREGWIKIKPEYTPGAMTELDLVIIGGYYGEGRRRGLISHFLLAVSQPPSTPGGEPAIFETITRVGSGCSLEQLAELSRKLESHWKRWKPTAPPSHILCTREKPHLWIEPRDSVVLQIKASEIVRSDYYHTGYTLRFPRIEKVRYDKPWRDCLTTEEFTTLRQNACGSLVAGGEILAQSPKAKIRRVTQSKPTIASHYRNSDLDEVASLTNMLQDKEICVLTGLSEMSKQQLECKVKENGGTVVLNPGTTTYCIVVGNEKNIRVTNVCRNGLYDVVRAQWLMNCFDAGQLLPWGPADVISASPTTAEQLKDNFDCYGDSYTEPATLHSLKQALSQVDKKDISMKNMIDIDKMLFGGFSQFSIFRDCTAYFNCDKQTESDAYLMYDFRFQGGNVSTSITNDCTHIVVNSNELDCLEEIINEADERKVTVFIIQHRWVLDSIEAKTRLPEEKYLLHQ